MDWFEALTGFRETGYEETRGRLRFEDGRLLSERDGKPYATGRLELVSLSDLRARVKAGAGPAGRLRTHVVQGEVRRLHRAAENAGALFQVASQFNLLEMVSPSVSPEQGVTRYQNDHTQGPACAIATGAATIYRNYFVPVAGGEGQTRTRQLDGLADLGDALAQALNRPVSTLWTMRNGYALANAAGLAAIAGHLALLTADALDALRGRLRIGLLTGAEVTDAPEVASLRVSQAFCSALPVAYSDVPGDAWEAFARLVLESAYEATLCAAVLNARLGGSNVVFLTLLGGGAFGNRSPWIHDAVQRALRLSGDYDLDVRMVSYGAPSRDVLDAVRSP
jgi:hypothetical protein